MYGMDSPEERIGRLAKALSEMAAPLGYGVAAANDRCSLFLYRLSDPPKNWIAVLCAVLGEADRRSAAEALLDKYESGSSHTALFYDRYGGVKFPGGPLEEIELKAAAGWTARIFS